MTPAPRTDRWTYREYTGNLSLREARLALVLLAFLALGAEVALRLRPPTVTRTTQNSMHGVRAQLQAMEEDPRPKIVILGDSSMVGAGVLDDRETVAGRVRAEFGGRYGVYNLAVPGGTNDTSRFLLGVLKRRGIKGIETIVLETIPTKFFVPTPGAATPPDLGTAALDELERFAPFAPRTDRAVPTTMPERTEERLEYGLGRVSALYRARDTLRIKETGGFPAFWVGSHLLPGRVRDRLFGGKGGGNNRLSAQVQDAPYRPDLGQTTDAPVYFSSKGQFETLAETVALAKEISRRGPIVLLHPTHYEYDRISERQRASALSALGELTAATEALGKREGVPVVAIPSEIYQADTLWTRTPAHFTAPLHARVFVRLEPVMQWLLGR